MNTLNRFCSPMHPMDENLDDTDIIREKKIKFIKLRELTKSPYSIGSVIDIENKISKLEEQIKGFETKISWEDIDSDEVVDNGGNDNQIQVNLNIKKEKKEVEKFAGIFSVISTVDFNKPERIKKIVKKSLKNPSKSKLHFDNKALPKLIELCQHPGFNWQKITELPFSVQPEFILKRVHESQPLTFIKIYKEFFDKWFYCQKIQDLLNDMFWYIFISKYGSDVDKKDLSNYFSRASESYVGFLFKITMEKPYYQEKFKKVLPNLLSQALYVALSECFPDSWIQFNNDFVENIIQLVFFWLSGIRPTKGSWSCWNMEELKPTEQKLKENAIEEQLRIGFSDLQIEKKTPEKDQLKNSVSTKSTLLGALNHSNNVLFNVSGHSPLIQWYFKKNNININVGTSNLVKHKEILPRLNEDNSETLADVVSKSVKSLQSRKMIYKKFLERNSLETKRFQKLQKISNFSNEKRQEKLLLNKSKIHKLSNLIMHEYLKDKDSISFGADKAVTDAIQEA